MASASLICSNVVYMYLSVAFIQMLKASSPAAVLLVSYLMGVSRPSYGAVANILLIVFGVALASAGAIEFSWLGLGFQLAGVLFEALKVFGGAKQMLDVIDRLLFLLMVVEILHTVRVSMRSGRLTCEPFLIVGLIASIRRVLVLTLQTAEQMHAAEWSPQKEALFRASMIELGVLAGLILVMVVSIFLLHRARDADAPAGQE